MAQRATKRAKAKNGQKLAATPLPPPNDPQTEDNDFSEALRFVRALSSEQTDAEWDIRVYQVPSAVMGRGATGRQQFLFYVQLDDLPTLEGVLAKAYPGGGLFRVMIRVDGQLLKVVTLDIAPRPGYRPPPPDYLTPPALPSPPPQQDRQLEFFMQRMTDMMAQQATQTREMIAALANRPQSNFDDELKKYAALASLFPQQNNDRGFEMFEKGLALAAKLSEAGGGGRETGLMDILKTLLESDGFSKAIQGLSTMTQNPQPAPAALAPGQPAPMVQQAAPPPPAYSGPFLSAQNQMARNMIATLIAQADAGIDPVAVAAQIEQSAPDALFSELETQDDILGFLIQQFPDIAPRRQWFQNVIDAIWQSEESNPVPASPFLHASADRPKESPFNSARGAGGDAGNTQAHADAGTTG